MGREARAESSLEAQRHLTPSDPLPSGQGGAGAASELGGLLAFQRPWAQRGRLSIPAGAGRESSSFPTLQGDWVLGELWSAPQGGRWALRQVGCTQGRLPVCTPQQESRESSMVIPHHLCKDFRRKGRGKAPPFPLPCPVGLSGEMTPL